MHNNTNIRRPTYKFLCSVTPASTSSSKKRPRSSSETVSHWSDEEIVADDGLDSWKGLVNRDGEALTKKRRVSIKHNVVNSKYDSRYRNSSNKNQLLGRHVYIVVHILHIVHIVHILYVMLLARNMSLGQAIGLVGLTQFGLNVPLETSAHSDRVAVFRAAAHYALTNDEVEEILDVAEKPLISYLKGLTITAMRMWKYVIPEHVRLYFEDNVFNPTRGDAEIQKHL